MELFAKIVNGFKLLTIFAKKLHLRCLIHISRNNNSTNIKLGRVVLCVETINDVACDT